MRTVKYCLLCSENRVSSVNFGVFSTKLRSLEKRILVWKTFVLQIQGKDIERVTKFNYLWVILDEQLHWKEHINSICNKVNKRLGLSAGIRSRLTLKAAKCVYNTLIDSILCYTNTVWVNCEPPRAKLHSVYKIAPPASF